MFGSLECAPLESLPMCRVGTGDLDRHQKLRQPLRIRGFDGIGEREEEEAETVLDFMLPWLASRTLGTAQRCSGGSGSSWTD